MLASEYLKHLPGHASGHPPAALARAAAAAEAASRRLRLAAMAVTHRAPLARSFKIMAGRWHYQCGPGTAVAVTRPADSDIKSYCTGLRQAGSLSSVGSAGGRPPGPPGRQASSSAPDDIRRSGGCQVLVHHRSADSDGQ